MQTSNIIYKHNGLYTIGILNDGKRLVYFGQKENILCVRGNCDSEVDQMVLEFPIRADYAQVDLDGRTLFLTHGHLFNKEILLEKIPYMLAGSMQGLNTGGHAYDWSRGKNFSVEGAMRVYNREDIGPEVEIQQKEISLKQDLIAENIRLKNPDCFCVIKAEYPFV